MILFSTSRPVELTALMSRLRQIVYNFEISIEGEESRAQISDLAYANYPLAARILRVRRDNLLATMAAGATDETRFNVGQPEIIRPALSPLNCDRMQR